MEKFEKRLKAYAEKYDFQHKRIIFNYNIDPEQILYRNEALRTGNRDMYVEFLNKSLHVNIHEELKIFDSLAPRVMRLDRSSYLAWITEKGISLVESDIYIFDEDAILRGVRGQEDKIKEFKIEESWNELFHNMHIPEVLAKERSYFWVLDE